jgi:ribonuclease HI
MVPVFLAFKVTFLMGRAVYITSSFPSPSRMSMAKKYYVVWQGREKGIYEDWASCSSQVRGYSGAKFKGFKTLAEAKKAFDAGAATSATATNRAVAKPSKAARPNRGAKVSSAAEIEAVAAELKIFTDGGCEPNPGEAGSGIALYRNNALVELWFGLYNPEGTNNTAELNALNQALMMAEEEITAGRTAAIFCDSKYSIDCICQWAAGWERNGWKKKGGEIKNLELIQEMFTRYKPLVDTVTLYHVPAHVGIEGNELADRMSILAIAAKDKDFIRYSEALDIPRILDLRAG